VVPEGVDPFRRYGCKMATGAGKTTVTAMLAAWSILNKVAARGDARYSDVVLVVCPNVTIRERLVELDLVPRHAMPSLRRGRVLVKNWHEFERKGMSAGAKVQKNGVREPVKQTVKLGSKTTSGRVGRYLTEQALELAVAPRARSASGVRDLARDERDPAAPGCCRFPGVEGRATEAPPRVACFVASVWLLEA